MHFPITHFLWLVFDLPNGSIWSNIWANLVWIPLAGLTLWVLHRKHIKEIESKFEEKFKEQHTIIKEILNDSKTAS